MMSSNFVVNAYRKYADNYDFIVNFYKLFGLRIEKYRQMTVELMGLSKGDTVVEIGCGTGLNFPLVLEKIGSEGKLIGVDITDKMLEQAQKKILENNWSNVELVESDIAEYSFPDKIDGVFSTGAIQYSPQYDKVIKNAHNALKQGRKIVIMDFKKSYGIARMFTSILLYFTSPFGANKEYIERKAWKSIEKYFDHTTYKEGWGGFLYVSVGTK